MHELNNIGLDDKAALDAVFRAENSRSADFCFGNIYMWDRRFRQSYELAGNRLVTLLHRGAEPFFAFPVGSGDIRPAMDMMRAYCRSSGIPLRLCGVEQAHRELLDGVYPGLFSYADDRDFSDYIYSVSDLASYAGKRLHAKRNYCNRFQAQYENDWRYVPLRTDIIPDCLNMLAAWEVQCAERLTEGIDDEHDAIVRYFAGFDRLGMEGGALYIGERMIGFTVGEQISSDCYCTHFEKAFPDIDGAYTMLCRETARRIMAERPDVRYVNREDDMGNLALRQSKLSYKPEFILEKYIASVVD